jgi:hypothetical protein
MDFGSKYWVAIFPYLKTSVDVQYKNIRIISSSDTSRVPTEIVAYVTELCSIFYLRHDVQIKKVSFAYRITEDEVQSPTSFINDLDEFQTLIRYIYSSPHPTSGNPFLNFEHSSYFLFRPKQVSKYLLFSEHNTIIHADINTYSIDEFGNIQGFEGLLNNRSPFWITRKDKITSQTAHIWLNISQDISLDFNRNSPLYQPVIAFFSYKTDNEDLRSRVITAINWFNRSLLTNIDDDVALVNLAIAFESLLGLEQGNKVTERFKETVCTLLGGFPRLDSWLSQFYHARSEIVHDGKSQRLSFLPVDKSDIKVTNKPEYQPLISYGRQIFQACTTSILTGSMLAEHMSLPSRLVTNQQRIKTITEKLSSKTTPAHDAILSVEKEIIEIESYRFVPESGLKVDELLFVGIVLSKKYTEISSVIEFDEINKKLKEFSNMQVKNHLETLSCLYEVTELMKKLPGRIYFDNKVLYLTKSLLECIWHYLFMYYFNLKRNNEQPE